MRSLVFTLSPSSRAYAVCLIFALTWLAACSVPPSRVPPPVPGTRATQTGIASWYGPGFHGKLTASGDIYNQYDLTAAHQTLPLGTNVMVTNLENGKSVEVLINDRGPFAKGRIIDLSYSAAEALGMIGPGTIPVRVEVIDTGPQRISFIKDSLDYTVQIGSFIRLENARQLHDQLAGTHPEVIIIPLHGKHGTYYRVQLGTFRDKSAAEEQARRLAETGYAAIVLEK